MGEAFTFGRNWISFSRTLDDRRVEDAQESLQFLLGASGLQGSTFLDIGAGSGLFSIAALKLGADRAAAVDRDDDCLAAIRSNAGRLLAPNQFARLEICAGDVLEPKQLPPDLFDVVYAWGSLHHTGAMWQAIENASRSVRPGGAFVLAIYNHTWTSPLWHATKRAYRASPAPLRWTMVAALSAVRVLGRALSGKRALRVERGMEIWHDAIDWLGGLPYEYASSGSVEAFLGKQGFEVINRRLTTRSGCNEFVAVRME